VIKACQSGNYRLLSALPVGTELKTNPSARIPSPVEPSDKDAILGKKAPGGGMTGK